MADWLMKVIKAEAARLLDLAAEDAELRADLRALAQRDPVATADQERPSIPAPLIAPTAGEQADSNRPAEPLRELTLGRSSLPKRLLGRDGEGQSDRIQSRQHQCDCRSMPLEKRGRSIGRRAPATTQ